MSKREGKKWGRDQLFTEIGVLTYKWSLFDSCLNNSLEVTVYGEMLSNIGTAIYFPILFYVHTRIPITNLLLRCNKLYRNYFIFIKHFIRDMREY